MRSTKAEDNLKLVHYVLKKYFHKAPHEQDYDDFFQVGCMGLVKASNSYNPSIAEFSTYAVLMIRGEIMRYIRDYESRIKLPRAILTKIWKYIKLYNKGMTDLEICKALNIDKDKLMDIKKAYRTKAVLFLDAQVPNLKEGESNLYEIIPDEIDVEEYVIENLTREKILNLLSKVLTKRDFYVFSLMSTGKTQEEVGRIIGVSQVQVSRIMCRIQSEVAQAIRNYFNGDDTDIKRLIEKRKMEEKQVIKGYEKHVEVVKQWAKEHPGINWNVMGICRENGLALKHTTYASHIKRQAIEELKKEGYTIVEKGRTAKLADGKGKLQTTEIKQKLPSKNVKSLPVSDNSLLQLECTLDDESIKNFARTLQGLQSMGKLRNQKVVLKVVVNFE